jgi:hypothetical protein
MFIFHAPVIPSGVEESRDEAAELFSAGSFDSVALRSG